MMNAWLLLASLLAQIQEVPDDGKPSLLPEQPGREGRLIFVQQVYALRDRARATVRDWKECVLNEAGRHEWYETETMVSAKQTTIKQCSRFEAYYEADVDYIARRRYQVTDLPDVDVQRSYRFEEAEKVLAYVKAHRD